VNNSSAEVVLKWGDGDHLFALKVPQIDELQRVTAKVIAAMFVGAGIGSEISTRAIVNQSGIGGIYQRLVGGEPLRSDVREAIRLGLIGGGAPALEALKLVETYVDPKSLASRSDVKDLARGKLPDVGADGASNLATAIVIVSAAFVGMEDLPKGKVEAGTTEADMSTSRPSTGNGAPSSEPQQTSAS
jgi:hypothetical protein